MQPGNNQTCLRPHAPPVRRPLARRAHALADACLTPPCLLFRLLQVPVYEIEPLEKITDSYLDQVGAAWWVHSLPPGVCCAACAMGWPRAWAASVRFQPTRPAYVLTLIVPATRPICAVPVVRERQAAPVPQLDQARGQRAAAAAGLQVVPGGWQDRAGRIKFGCLLHQVAGAVVLMVAVSAAYSSVGCLLRGLNRATRFPACRLQGINNLTDVWDTANGECVVMMQVRNVSRRARVVCKWERSLGAWLAQQSALGAERIWPAPPTAAPADLAPRCPAPPAILPAVDAGEAVGEGGPHAAQPPAAPHCGPQHRRLHDL